TEEFATIVVDAEAAAHSQLRRGTPGDSNARRKSPLMILHHRVAGVVRDFKPRVGDGIGVRVVRKLVAVKGRQPAVFLRERSIEIPAQPKRYRQVAAQFVVVVDEGAYGVSPIVPIRRSAERIAIGA